MTTCRDMAIALVYRCRSCGRRYCLYIDVVQACPYCRSSDHEHTMTVDPVVMLTRYLNRDRRLRADLEGRS